MAYGSKDIEDQVQTTESHLVLLTTTIQQVVSEITKDGCAFAMLQPGNTSTRYWPHLIHRVAFLMLRRILESTYLYRPLAMLARNLPQRCLEQKPSLIL